MECENCKYLKERLDKSFKINKLENDILKLKILILRMEKDNSKKELKQNPKYLNYKIKLLNLETINKRRHTKWLEVTLEDVRDSFDEYYHKYLNEKDYNEQLKRIIQNLKKEA